MPLSRRTAIVAGLAALATPLLPALSRAGKVNTFEGLAIEGYDPVAYFTQDRAVEGSPDLAADHGGATYRFASAANRETFLADPKKYAPRYGGYCAYAMAQGALAPVDPHAFTVVDGRLYLNFSKSVRSTWQQDIPGNIEKADVNWPALGAD